MNGCDFKVRKICSKLDMFKTGRVYVQIWEHKNFTPKPDCLPLKLGRHNHRACRFVLPLTIQYSRWPNRITLRTL